MELDIGSMKKMFPFQKSNITICASDKLLNSLDEAIILYVMKDKTTDELCDIIVKEVGIGLPRYSYELRKYVSDVPENIREGDKVVGVYNSKSHDTFREACFRIIYWNENK